MYATRIFNRSGIVGIPNEINPNEPVAFAGARIAPLADDLDDDDLDDFLDDDLDDDDLDDDDLDDDLDY